MAYICADNGQIIKEEKLNKLAWVYKVKKYSQLMLFILLDIINFGPMRSQTSTSEKNISFSGTINRASRTSYCK